eukprot:SAG22_NODE_404_length_11005_cov_8.751788_10_plen_331_part_00
MLLSVRPAPHPESDSIAVSNSQSTCCCGTARKGTVLARKTVEAQQKGSALQLTFPVGPMYSIGVDRCREVDMKAMSTCVVCCFPDWGNRQAGHQLGARQETADVQGLGPSAVRCVSRTDRQRSLSRTDGERQTDRQRTAQTCPSSSGTQNDDGSSPRTPRQSGSVASCDSRTARKGTALARKTVGAQHKGSALVQLTSGVVTAASFRIARQMWPTVAQKVSCGCCATCDLLRSPGKNGKPGHQQVRRQATGGSKVAVRPGRLFGDPNKGAMHRGSGGPRLQVPDKRAGYAPELAGQVGDLPEEDVDRLVDRAGVQPDGDHLNRMERHCLS